MAYLILATLTLAPAYAIRFKFFGLPGNLLMLWVFGLWLAFFYWLIVKRQLADFWKYLKNFDRKILSLCGLFFLAGVTSLFVQGFSLAKLGQFFVLFLQPIPLFFIAGFIFKQDHKAKLYLLTAIYCLLAASGVFALVQYFTLFGLPQSYWGNSVEPKRVLAFFVHPNFFALWASPLLALLIPDAAESLKQKIFSLKSLSWALGAVGLLLSLSRAGWLGLGTAITIYLIVAADQKIRRLVFGAAVIIAIAVVAIPNLRWRVILPFYGENSAGSRLELWQSGINAIKISPVWGLGLNGYSERYTKLVGQNSGLDTHNFPHNIFLNFWVETGLLGLISFVGLAWVFIYKSFKNRSNIFILGVALFLVALIAQGQIDNPYFKNDLALVFWMVLSLSF